MELRPQVRREHPYEDPGAVVRGPFGVPEHHDAEGDFAFEGDEDGEEGGSGEGGGLLHLLSWLCTWCELLIGEDWDLMLNGRGLLIGEDRDLVGTSRCSLLVGGRNAEAWDRIGLAMV